MSLILIVEDEPKISRFVSLQLEHEGYETTVIGDGLQGLQAATEQDYDLIVLDLMLPSLNGIELLRRLRLSKDTPVIILSARDETADKVTGLDVGACDYMTKPFAMEELLARIRAQLRHKRDESKEIGLRVDNTSRTVTFGGNVIDLTKKEFDLLAFLLANKSKVVTREQALGEVWGYDFVGNTNLVDVFVRYLRTKIDDRFGVKLIETVRGVGYVIR